MNFTAFDPKAMPAGVRLKAIFSSDMGHWDVPDMRKVLHEAWELVEQARITAEDFRDFVFTHPVQLFAGMNPQFFAGTAVADEVDRLLRRSELVAAPRSG